MNDKDPTKEIFEKAKEFCPFGEPADFGFETRLRAAIAETPADFNDWVAWFSWRLSIVSLPLILALLVFVAMQQGAYFPEGSSALVAQWASLLPVDL